MCQAWGDYLWQGQVTCGSGGVIHRVLLLLHGCGSSVGGWLAWADSLAWRRAVTARVCTHGTLGGISIFIAVAAGVAVTVFVASLAAAGFALDGVSLAVGTHVVGHAVLTVCAPVAVPTNL